MPNQFVKFKQCNQVATLGAQSVGKRMSGTRSWLKDNVEERYIIFHLLIHATLQYMLKNPRKAKFSLKYLSHF